MEVISGLSAGERIVSPVDGTVRDGDVILIEGKNGNSE
jgi:hypothetical protein